MRKLAVLSTDTQLNEKIELICEKYNYFFEPYFFESLESSIEFLEYELPELIIINYSDHSIDAKKAMQEIRQDPWLHYGGIIVVHPAKDRMAVIQEMPELNIIAQLTRKEFVRGFFRLLKILIQNRNIIFQRDLQRFLLPMIQGSLVMDNDPFNVGTYANIIPNYLYNSNYLSLEAREQLHIALFEMLMNAVEHGNCSINYDEKSEWLSSHGDILDLIRKKMEDPQVKSKKVHFEYKITPERSYYIIRDEGVGFDWQSRLDNTKAHLDLHGRGIQMTGIYVENLRYNEKGNEVSFEMAHQKNESNAIPAIFADQEEVQFKDGDVVFKEGEESSYLYFIANGSLKIYSKGQMVSRLSPDDILLGEMSFLLSNRRSATVISNGPCTLLKVSKNAFVNSIKHQPHYGILLARLLAGRLQRLNSYVSDLKKDKNIKSELKPDLQGIDQ